MAGFVQTLFPWNSGFVTVPNMFDKYILSDISQLEISSTSRFEISSTSWFSFPRIVADEIEEKTDDDFFSLWPCSQGGTRSCLLVEVIACGQHRTTAFPLTLFKIYSFESLSLSIVGDMAIRLHESDEKNSLCNTPESGYASNASSIQSSPVASETSVSSAVDC
ncbi:unnamed protein product, partial [Meganyctiphanes norvegica]